MSEIYVSTDIESDGPIPGANSMLSFGSAAFLPSGKMRDTFSANLETLPGAVPDPGTMEWWSGKPEAWASCRADTRDPAEAMTAYVKWLKSLPGKPVFVGYPAGYDFLFVYWYLIRFAGESPFSFSALDIKSYAMAMLGTEFRRTAKRNMPKRWFGKRRHTHVALDDAIEQGMLFCNMLAENTVRLEQETASVMTFDGMIKCIDGATATVVLLVDGNRETRTMLTEELSKNGVRHEGQAFTIAVRETRRPNGRVRKEIEIDPVGDPATQTVKALRPDSDFTKFGDMP